MLPLFIHMQYKLWKGFAIWRRYVRRRLQGICRKALKKQLFSVNPILQRVLLQICEVLRNLDISLIECIIRIIKRVNVNGTNVYRIWCVYFACCIKANSEVLIGKFYLQYFRCPWEYQSCISMIITKILFIM
jgi:hypothetical protein